jgi:hypothetical protein
MKNIHVLPTQEPSKLHYYNTYLNTDFYGLSKEPLNWRQARHIYITSDKEINDKTGPCWCINTLKRNNNLVYYYQGAMPGKPRNDYHFVGFKKVILTTDKTLIDNCDVESIDVDFLEWFVKNPTCEFVKIKNKTLKIPERFGNDYRLISYLKIIIPKEEKANVLKCQEARMYSEEEVLNILYKHTEDLLAGKKLTLEEWFEQFKKK